MVISSFISSILVLALGIWAYLRLEPTMNLVAERQLLIEPSKFSYKMWKDMPVSMYQSFTFFNLTNWNQVKSIGQKPKFVEVGPYVYKTIWTKSDINFMDEERLVSYSERKQWIFQSHLSKGNEDDQIWTINTPLMTALALIQNAPVITRNIVSVILDGLGEGAFIKRNIRSLLFEGYSDLIVSVGPLFDRRFANFNGKFAYLYNKNDSVDGTWTVSTGTDEISSLNKITRFQSSIVNMTSSSSGQPPQGLNEVKPECASSWSLDQASNGQLWAPFNVESEQEKLLEQQLEIATNSHHQVKARSTKASEVSQVTQMPIQARQEPVQTKRFFSRSIIHDNNNNNNNNQQHQEFVANPFLNQKPFDPSGTRAQQTAATSSVGQDRPQLRDLGKYIFYPDLCRPLHLLPGKQEMTTSTGIKVSRYYIDPRVFMNSSQVPTNKCFEMNPRPPLANALAATINSVTGANVAMPNLVTGASSPFAIFSGPPNNHHHNENSAGLFERSNHPTSFLNNALHSLGAGVNNNNQQDQQTSSSNNQPISRLGRVRQLFSNIVSQRMSAAGPGSLLPSLASGSAGLLIGNHFPSTARNSADEPVSLANHHHLSRPTLLSGHEPRNAAHLGDGLLQGSNPIPLHSAPATAQPTTGGSDRWITQFRFKWPRGVFSIGQCQLGAPIYASLPHFLDADEYYLEQVDGLKPNRSLHEFYIDVESSLHSIPIGAKARLQLNVATPELRFRNIPNAMIPVLWQEVTFDIDKPIATMLYWSFTMSSTIYKLISLTLLTSGSIILAFSFLGCYREHKRRRIDNRENEDGTSTSGGSQHAGDQLQQQLEGQRSSWQAHILHNGSMRGGCVNGKTHNDIRLCGGVLNQAFSTEFHDRLSDHNSGSSSGPNSSNTINGSGSPKQPSSRASSHCELVSSLGNSVNCTGCLLACLRHSQTTNSNNHIHEHLARVSDNSIVRKKITTSDIDKATLSSRESNLDSCSSIYTPRKHSSSLIGATTCSN